MKEITETGKQLKSINLKIEEKKEDIDRIRASVDVQAVNYDKIGSASSQKNSTEDKTIRYIDQISELNELIAQKDKLEGLFHRLVEKKLAGDRNHTRRRVYKLYYLDNLTVKQIAQKIPCAVGTVKNYLFCEN